MTMGSADTRSQISQGRSSIQAIVRETLLTQAKRGTKTARPKGKQPARGKKRADSNTWVERRKASTKCYDCNEVGHWAGDPKCTSPKASRAGFASAVNPPSEKVEEPVENLTFFQ